MDLIYTEAMLADALENAARGVGAISAGFGNRDWMQDIDPHDLDMDNTELCIVGQLRRASETSRATIQRLQNQWRTDFGYYLGESTGGGYPFIYGLDVPYGPQKAEQFAALNEAWRRILAMNGISE